VAAEYADQGHASQGTTASPKPNRTKLAVAAQSAVSTAPAGGISPLTRKSDRRQMVAGITGQR
jgi:hypothetical protein